MAKKAVYVNVRKVSADEAARGAVYFPRPPKSFPPGGPVRLTQTSRAAKPMGFQVEI